MDKQSSAQKEKGVAVELTPVKGSVLERKCACGRPVIGGGECAACRKKRLSLQRYSIKNDTPDTAPPIVHDVLRSPGRQLDAAAPALVEPRFSHDFSGLHMNTAMSGKIQSRLTVNRPGDKYEQEADRVAEQIIRMTDPPPQYHARLAEEETPASVTSPLVRRQAKNRVLPSFVPPTVHEVLQLPGRPLNPASRAYMEPRFGRDFSRVRVHTNAKAAKSAREVNALAYAVGQDVVFRTGQYAPGTKRGDRLLAHELTHVVQQSGSRNIARKLPEAGSSNHIKELEIDSAVKHTTLCRSMMPGFVPLQIPNQGEQSPLEGNATVLPPPPTRSTVPSPEICPPPEEMQCPPAVNSPGAVTNTLNFPVDSATLNPLQIAEIAATAASWHAAGGAVTVRVDGYASAEGQCGYNWNLSCLRAQTVASELESPSDGSPGVPNGNIEVFAHGESNVAGPALAPNRQVTISIPAAPPTPTPPSPPHCTLPVRLGSARGCGSGDDFKHFDFPSISATSATKLAAWAAARPGPSGPSRSLVSNTECELEMDGVLTGLAGAAGHAAFSRFKAGTGGTVTHGPTSTLGAMALSAPSFLATVGRVKAAIETQLAAQATTGTLNPCALSVTPPATHFVTSDGLALKAVIGGTQGEELFATNFSGSIPMRSYTINLRFLICDDFGVDESDLYAPGLFPFWVLQHERSATLYAPFINELDLPVRVSGTF